MSEFTIHLNLGETASSSTKKRKVEDGGEVVKEETVDNRIHQKIRKLYEGDADEFIRWNKQLDTMIKDKSCDTAKYNFVMVAAMLYGYLLTHGPNILAHWQRNFTTKSVPIRVVLKWKSRRRKE